MTRERLNFLRSYPWSSYPSYVRSGLAPGWLCTETLLAGFAGATDVRRQRAYQRFVEQPIRAGTLDTILDRVLERLVDGSREFRDQVLKLARGEATHRAAVQKRAFRLDWPLLQQRVAELKAEPWSAFAERRNDEGRDLALYVARRFGGYTLAELGELVGVSYAAVAQAVERTKRRIAQSAATRKLYQDVAATFKLKA